MDRWNSVPSGNRQVDDASDRPNVLRGVIDRLEGEWAVVALDDEQRLDWPCRWLPRDAKEGMAVALILLRAGEANEQEAQGTWRGTVSLQEGKGAQKASVSLGHQALNWPASVGLAAGEEVVLQMQVDVTDTDRRRRQVQDLVDDLFG